MPNIYIINSIKTPQLYFYESNTNCYEVWSRSVAKKQTINRYPSLELAQVRGNVLMSYNRLDCNICCLTRHY